MPLVPPVEPTVSARVFLPVADCLRASGWNVDAILESAGLSGEVIRDADRRIPRSAMLRFVRAAIETTEDPTLSFRSAGFIRPDTFDILEYAARSSATIGDAIETTNRFARLIDDTNHYHLERSADRVLWWFEVQGDPEARMPIIEYLMASLRVVGARIAGLTIPAEAIWVRHPAPPHAAYYSEVFEMGVRFDAPHDAFVFHPNLLETPLPGADPGLARVLHKHVDRLVSELPTIETVRDGARAALAAELNGGDPSLGRVARRLGVTTATLQRRLAEEGTSFRLLLQDLRVERAHRYLSERRRTITEVAFLLGFQSTSAFHKAFRKATGETPAQYQARAQGAGVSSAASAPSAGGGRGRIGSTSTKA